MGKKKKIIYLVHLPPPIHGVSLFNKNVTESIRINNTIDSAIVKINFNTSIDQVNKFNFNKIFKYINLFFIFFFRIIKYRPDLIYYSIPPTGKGLYKDIPLVALIKFFRIHCIYHLHGKGIANEIKNNKIKFKIHNWVYGNSTVIHLSETLIRNEILPLNLKNAKLEVVNNGIQCFEENKKSIKKSDTVNILFLSNLWESKGILNALKIFAELKKSTNNIFLNIVGDFMDNRTKFLAKEIVTNLQIENFVEFHGKKYDSEKNEIIMKNDVLLYPSLNDAFPLVILECMSFGLVVFASDQGGIPDIVSEEYGGIFETGNDLMAVNLMKSYLNLSSKERLKMALCSKQVFDRKFRFERVENDLIKIFNN